MTANAAKDAAGASGFTEEQLAVVKHDGGHALVAAVAGSGKTETLLGRVKWLLKSGVPSQRILCLMYNRAAKVSFARRLGTAAASDSRRPEVHTFHGHARSIEMELVRAGRLPRAELLGSDDLRAKKLLKQVLRVTWKQRIGDDAWPSQRDAEDFQRFITLVKAQLGPPDVVADRLFQRAQAGHILSAFNLYETERKRAKWRSFDDLLYDTVPLIANDEALRRQFAGQYDHVLVDEMQDMNAIQACLLEIRAAPGAKVMGVGDDDQCLYEFRGADPSIFVSEFERMFPGTTRYTLSRTFRFGHTLAMAAGQLIAVNRHRIDKVVVAAPGTPDTTIDVHQRAFAASDLKAWREDGVLQHWSEVLILVRYRAQTVLVELELLLGRIPYEIDGSSGLFTTRIVGGLIALLSLSARRWPKAATPDDQEAMVRDLLKLPTLFLTAPQLQSAVDQAAIHLRLLAPTLRTIAGSLSDTNAQRAVRDRADLLEMLQDPAMADASAASVLDLYLGGTRMVEEIRRTALTPEAADEDLMWISAFRQFVLGGKGTVAEVIDALGVAREHADESERVRVTTMHGAKGLQSPIVVLPDWVTGAFPRDNSPLSMVNVGDEGERRLAYVGLTRAQYAAHVYTRDDVGFQAALKAQDVPEGPCQVSRYAYEMRLGTARAMDEALRGGRFARVRPTDASHARRYLAALGRSETIEEAPAPKRGAAASNAGAAPADSAWDIRREKLGNTVLHETWGPGKLLEIIDGRIARLVFPKEGERLILIDAGKLRQAQ